jgi:hypothetical protein
MAGPLSRRAFLRSVGGGGLALALAGITGCDPFGGGGGSATQQPRRWDPYNSGLHVLPSDLEVIPAADDEPDVVRTRYYALAMGTPVGGPLRVYASTESEDTLVRAAGDDPAGWLVRHRFVRHDG